MKGVMSVYSMNIDNNRVVAKVSLDYNKRYRNVLCVYDTGAMYTAIQASSLNIPKSHEEIYRGKFEEKLLGGLVKSTYKDCNFIRYYKVIFKEVAIGNIVLKNIPIWITFMDNVTNDVIGMDIISKLYTYIGDNKTHISSNRRDLVNVILNDSQERKPNLLGELPDIDLGGI